MSAGPPGSVPILDHIQQTWFESSVVRSKLNSQLCLLTKSRSGPPLETVLFAARGSILMAVSDLNTPRGLVFSY